MAEVCLALDAWLRRRRPPARAGLVLLVDYAEEPAALHATAPSRDGTPARVRRPRRRRRPVPARRPPGPHRHRRPRGRSRGRRGCGPGPPGETTQAELLAPAGTTTSPRLLQPAPAPRSRTRSPPVRPRPAAGPPGHGRLPGPGVRATAWPPGTRLGCAGAPSTRPGAARQRPAAAATGARRSASTAPPTGRRSGPLLECGPLGRLRCQIDRRRVAQRGLQRSAPLGTEDLVTGIWYVVGFAFAGVPFVFGTIGLAWLISHRDPRRRAQGLPVRVGDRHVRRHPRPIRDLASTSTP